MTNEEFIQSIALEGEEWKPIAGFNDKYIVSNFGRIASVPILVNRKEGLYPLPGRVKAQRLAGKSSHMYYYVSFTSGHKKCKSYPIHKLVAKAFIPNPESKPCVDHIDGNQLNNHADNLRWVTYKENAANSITANRRLVVINRPFLCLKDGIPYKRFTTMKDAINEGFNDCRIRICFKNPQSKHRGYTWMRESDYESLVNKSKNTLPAPITADYPQ